MKIQNQIRNGILLFMCVCTMSLISCESNIDKRLDKLESTIEKYEAKAKKEGLKEADIQQMNSELDAIGTEIPENASVEQHQRLMRIGDREGKLEEQIQP